MAHQQKTSGPECAVLTSIGTVYLYRLTSADARAFSDLPATRLSVDKFRTLLGRVGSTAVSDKGILDAGAMSRDEVESLNDDEIERLAESYLESTSLRWYGHEGASATIAVIRNPGEPAVKFVDRLVNWYAASRVPRQEADGLSATAPRPRPRALAPDAVVLPKREAWIALGALIVLGILGIGAFLQHYLLVNSLERQQQALVAEVKQTNAMLGAYVARAAKESADLHRRLDALESSLRAQPQPAAKPAATRSRTPAAPAKARKSKSPPRASMRVTR